MNSKYFKELREVTQKWEDILHGEDYNVGDAIEASDNISKVLKKIKEQENK